MWWCLRRKAAVRNPTPGRCRSSRQAWTADDVAAAAFTRSTAALLGGDEQNVQQVLDVVDRAYLLEVGNIKLAGTAAEFKNNDLIRKSYMGL